MADKNELEVKRKGTKSNYPTIYDVKGESLKKIMRTGIELAKQEPCNTEKECIERFDWYFDWCLENEIKPSVEGFALAMGVHRDTIHSWEKGERSLFHKNLVKKAKDIIFYFMTTAVMNNEINNVTWMFYGKNYYGYEDKKQIELSTTNVNSLTEEEMEKITSELPDTE